MRTAEEIAKEFARAWSFPRGRAWSVDDIHDAIRRAQVEALEEAIAIAERYTDTTGYGIATALRAVIRQCS